MYSVFSVYCFHFPVLLSLCSLFFFFNDPATPEISPLPLPAALPISAFRRSPGAPAPRSPPAAACSRRARASRGELGFRSRPRGRERNPSSPRDARARREQAAAGGERGAGAPGLRRKAEIGRAAGRGRGEISGVAGSLKKKKREQAGKRPEQHRVHRNRKWEKLDDP